MDRKKEFKTISLMLQMYCRSTHKTNTLCKQCSSLLDYCYVRLEKCPHKNDKPFCSTCEINCYEANKREQIKTVMRSVRVKMMFYHPILSIQHIFAAIKNRSK